MPTVKRLWFAVLLAALSTVHAETESIDLKALAKKARPAVMLLVVSDAAGKEIATGTGFLVSSDGKPKRSGDAAVSLCRNISPNTTSSKTLPNLLRHDF